MSQLDDILAPALKTHTLTEIARMAKMSYSHLRDVRRGRRPATPELLAQLGIAVRRLKLRGIDVKLERRAIYRVVLALTAQSLGLDPVSVQVSDPGAKKAANREWREASLARWMAQYLLNTKLNMPQAQVARASGVTKQAVSLAMREIELKRDDPEFDARLAKLEDVFEDVTDAQ